MSTQAPSQQSPPWVEDTGQPLIVDMSQAALATQVPSSHHVPAGHAFPHAPQFLGSNSILVQAPVQHLPATSVASLQVARSWAPTQSASTQLPQTHAPWGQAAPQARQFPESVQRSTQVPLQQVPCAKPDPTTQVSPSVTPEQDARTQPPALQVKPKSPWQKFPQLPQFWPSAQRSTHSPPQQWP